ncbi:unnamed protein product [Prunus armeniaca]
MSRRDSLANDERLNALEGESLKHKMPRIDSKRLPLRLKRSCTDMADIVTEQWIQIQQLGQALHITQILTFDHALLFAERKKKKICLLLLLHRNPKPTHQRTG